MKIRSKITYSSLFPSDILKRIFAIPVFLFLITASGCRQPRPVEEDSPLEHRTESLIDSVKHDDVEILVIDKCQYIVYKEVEGSNRAYGYMAHKGNCNNPVHCYKDTRSVTDSVMANEAQQQNKRSKTGKD